MRNMMMGAGRVMSVHCMRQCGCNDVVLVAWMRQRESFWWPGFGVVVFLGEERDDARPPLVGDETAPSRRDRPRDRQRVAWRSRLPGKSEAAGISPAYSVQLPTSIIIIPRRRRRDREIDTDDRSIYPPTLPS